MKKLALIFFAVFLIISTALYSYSAEISKPLYVFLFIGDGMGKNQYIAAMRSGLTKHIDMLPVSGEVVTKAFGNVITDSAAAATAIATGKKTHNERLGLDSKGIVAKNITEAAIENGMSVGIISTMSINHATPAGFYAHIKSRKEYYEIGLQLISSEISYWGGGGFYHSTGKGKNRENLYSLAERAGYRVFMNGKIPDTEKLKSERVKIISVNPALRPDACMPYVEKRHNNGRALSDFVKEAIQILSDNNAGFLIITEGGNIDYACHDNETGRMLSEIADFDEAVSEALNFYKNHSGNTLIVVTADHETGGLHFVSTDSNSVKWGGKYHTAARVPIFAIGINSDVFYGETGIIENTDIAKNIFDLLRE